MKTDRELFDEWYQDEVSGCNGEWLERDDDGEYYEKTTRDAWLVWQAATAANAIVLAAAQMGEQK